jgi:hypothetical protein
LQRNCLSPLRRRDRESPLVSLREVLDSLIVEGFLVFRAQHERLPLSHSAEVPCKGDKPGSGS